MTVTKEWFRNASVGAWNFMVARLPGSAIFFMAGPGVVRKAAVEFVTISFFSVLPLLTIVLTNSLSESGAPFWSELSRYTKAGEVFFFVGPVVGASVYLLWTEFRRSLNGPRFAAERFWFLLYSMGSILIAVVMLVVHHLEKTGNGDSLRVASYWVYGISLYFSFLQFVYGNFEGASSVDGPPEKLDELNRELAGFNGDM